MLSFRRAIPVAAAMIGAGALLSGCELGGRNEPAPPATVKVMTSASSTFYSQYGGLFMALHPNVDLELLAPPDGADLASFVRENSPDVLLLSASEYERLAQDGLLEDLGPRIRKDKYPLDGTVPTVVDALRSLGGGALYGLSPSFSGQALYYNKDLFRQEGVPLPQAGMSWGEILRLAERFPTNGNDSDRIYGFMSNAYSANPFEFALMVGSSEGMDYLDRDKLQMKIDTDRWKEVFGLVLDALKSGAIYQAGQAPQPGATYAESLRQHPFIAGRAAMTVATGDLMTELQRAEAVMRTPDWDVAAVPDGSLEVNDIFAVYRGAAQPDLAWELVKYVNSDDYARIASKDARFGSMTSRLAYLKDEAGRHLEAFYQGSASLPGSPGKVPQSFYASFDPMSKAEIGKVLDGTQSLDEALAAVQSQGQAMLMLAAKKQKEQTGNE